MAVDIIANEKPKSSSWLSRNSWTLAKWGGAVALGAAAGGALVLTGGGVTVPLMSGISYAVGKTALFLNAGIPGVAFTWAPGAWVPSIIPSVVIKSATFGAGLGAAAAVGTVAAIDATIDTAAGVAKLITNKVETSNDKAEESNSKVLEAKPVSVSEAQEELSISYINSVPHEEIPIVAKEEKKSFADNLKLSKVLQPSEIDLARSH